MVEPAGKPHLHTAEMRRIEDNIQETDKTITELKSNIPLVTLQLLQIADSLDRIEANLDRSNKLSEERIEWINTQEGKILDMLDKIFKVFRTAVDKISNVGKSFHKRVSKIWEVL